MVHWISTHSFEDTQRQVRQDRALKVANCPQVLCLHLCDIAAPERHAPLDDNGSVWREYRHRSGESLWRGRREEELTLRDLASDVDIYFSQLSRIERAQSTRSALIKVSDTGCDGTLDECIFEFSKQRLKKLADRGGMC